MPSASTYIIVSSNIVNLPPFAPVCPWLKLGNPGKKPLGKKPFGKKPLGKMPLIWKVGKSPLKKAPDLTDR